MVPAQHLCSGKSRYGPYPTSEVAMCLDVLCQRLRIIDGGCSLGPRRGRLHASVLLDLFWTHQYYDCTYEFYVLATLTALAAGRLWEAVLSHSVAPSASIHMKVNYPVHISILGVG